MRVTGGVGSSGLGVVNETDTGPACWSAVIDPLLTIAPCIRYRGGGYTMSRRIVPAGMTS